MILRILGRASENGNTEGEWEGEGGKGAGGRVGVELDWAFGVEGAGSWRRDRRWRSFLVSFCSTGGSVISPRDGLILKVLDLRDRR